MLLQDILDHPATPTVVALLMLLLCALAVFIWVSLTGGFHSRDARAAA